MNTLYVIATPIGNTKDLSPRGQEVLRCVDVVLCEDTRVTKKLLAAHNIDASTRAIHQHSGDQDLENVVAEIQHGKSMAYVSDAGTPGISDPGGKLVALAVQKGVEVVPIPGPSAVTTALSVCGFPADTFTFLGFPPQKKGRRRFFESLGAIPHTIVLYESKHRIEKTLAALPQDRPLMVARELTKMHETLYRGTAATILKDLETSSTKGEFVIVLAPSNWTV